jgi:pectate lyase
VCGGSIQVSSQASLFKGRLLWMLIRLEIKSLDDPANPSILGEMDRPINLSINMHTKESGNVIFNIQFQSFKFRYCDYFSNDCLVKREEQNVINVDKKK